MGRWIEGPQKQAEFVSVDREIVLQLAVKVAKAALAEDVVLAGLGNGNRSRTDGGKVADR